MLVVGIHALQVISQQFLFSGGEHRPRAEEAHFLREIRYKVGYCIDGPHQDIERCVVYDVNKGAITIKVANCKDRRIGSEVRGDTLKIRTEHETAASSKLLLTARCYVMSHR